MTLLTKIDEGRKAAFLEELTALTRKHGIKVEGCGCCESPWLAETKPEDSEKLYSVHDEGYLCLRSPETVKEEEELRKQEEEWWGKDD